MPSGLDAAILVTVKLLQHNKYGFRPLIKNSPVASVAVKSVPPYTVPLDVQGGRRRRSSRCAQLIKKEITSDLRNMQKVTKQH